MTTTENTRDTKLVFRNKFAKLIQCDYEHQVFEEAFEKFFALKPEEALDMLWKLTYAPAINILEKIGLYAGISDEMFIALRNELRHQYKEVHPDFLNVDVPEECQNAFTALKNQTDDIVATIVFNHCSMHQYASEEYMIPHLSRLQNSKENVHCGGIKGLDFNWNETSYLKQYHGLIHDLLKATYEHYQKQCGMNTSNSPFAVLGKLMENGNTDDLPFYMEKNVDVAPQPDAVQPETVQPETVQSETVQPAQNSGPSFKSLTAEEIMAHKDAFASFVKDADLNILVQIGQLGFDLNEVMAKKDAISNLLKAIESKKKAEAKVLAATKSMEKAEAKLLKATSALSK